MIEQKGCDVILSISAKPNSREFSIRLKGDKLMVYLKNRAENSRANIELIKEFRRILKKDASLVSGGKSKTKKLIIRNIAKCEVEDALMASQRD